MDSYEEEEEERQRETKSPLGCATNGAGGNGVDEGGASICLVTEMSAWQMQL